MANSDWLVNFSNSFFPYYLHVRLSRISMRSISIFMINSPPIILKFIEAIFYSFACALPFISISRISHAVPILPSYLCFGISVFHVCIRQWAIFSAFVVSICFLLFSKPPTNVLVFCVQFVHRFEMLEYRLNNIPGFIFDLIASYLSFS